MNWMDGVRPFADRLGKAVTRGGFAMEGYWVWCGSVGKGRDGRYHTLASRWPKTYPFFQGYTAASEIVRAVADKPEGPFVFQEVVLGARDPSYWDGRMAHNPHLFRWKDGWYLFYCGATYGEEATPEWMWELNRDPSAGKNGRMPPWMKSMQTGVAFAEDLAGPWRRPDQPLELAHPDQPEKRRIVNLCAVVTPDGRVRVIYRVSGVGLVTALADHPAGPFPDTGKDLFYDYEDQSHIEDPYVFRREGHYEMLSKDSHGVLCGEPFGLAHLVSRDGFDWRPAKQPKAASRKVLWDDGAVREMGNLERPYVLIEDGEPRCLYSATSDGAHGKEIDGKPRAAHYNAENTWCLAIPLEVH
mgnify:CR=1 FL=1